MPKKAYLVLAISWTVLVGILCLVSFKQLPSTAVKGADKYVHAFFHFVFTILWYLALQNRDQESGSLRIFFKVLLLSVFFGVVIEIAQGMLTETRQSDIADVLANFAGAFLAVICLYLFRNSIKKSHTL